MPRAVLLVPAAGRPGDGALVVAARRRRARAVGRRRHGGPRARRGGARRLGRAPAAADGVRAIAVAPLVLPFAIAGAVRQPRRLVPAGVRRAPARRASRSSPAGRRSRRVSPSPSSRSRSFHPGPLHPVGRPASLARARRVRSPGARRGRRGRARDRAVSRRRGRRLWLDYLTVVKAGAGALGSSTPATSGPKSPSSGSDRLDGAGAALGPGRRGGRGPRRDAVRGRARPRRRDRQRRHRRHGDLVVLPVTWYHYPVALMPVPRRWPSPTRDRRPWIPPAICPTSRSSRCRSSGSPSRSSAAAGGASRAGLSRRPPPASTPRQPARRPRHPAQRFRPWPRTVPPLRHRDPERDLRRAARGSCSRPRSERRGDLPSRRPGHPRGVRTPRTSCTRP